MKNHTFLEVVEKRTETRTTWKCQNCGANFSYCGDPMFEHKFDRAWKESGIDVDCNIEIVKSITTS